MAHKYRLLIHSARQVVKVTKNGERVLVGEAMKEVDLLEESGGSGNSILVDNEGKIAAMGSPQYIDEHLKKEGGDVTSLVKNVLDAQGMVVMPGFVDAHTHPVWAGDRVHEFAMKLAGATYMEVHNAGGGINFTVGHTTRATEDELFSLLEGRLRRMLEAGTTTVECKTGYGLEWEAELKMLRVIERARRELPWINVVSTYCAAHAVPKGTTAEAATLDIIDNQIPALQQLMAAGELAVNNIDVFCEKGVFDLDQSRRILEAGGKIGLEINFHGDELHPMKAAEMGAGLKAAAISHLEEISEGGVSAMADAGSVAVLLPTTAYILRLKCPPARDMAQAGVPLALGSDFNPNAFCLAMPVVMHLACVLMRLSMPEALVAATINSAAALKMSQEVGSLEVGKRADIIVVDAPRWEHVVYQLAGHASLIRHVVKDGLIVHSRPE